MQTEETDSNKHLFEDTFCLITSDGELKQKDNAFFKGKTLKTEIKEDFEEHLKPFKDAFSQLEATIKASDDSSFNNLVEMASNAHAVGDFDTLLEGLKPDVTESAQLAPDTTEETELEIVDSEEEASNLEESVPVVLDSLSTALPVPATVSLTDDETSEAAANSTELADDSPEQFYKLLIGEAEAVANGNNWSSGQAELEAISRRWAEGPEIDAAIKSKLEVALEAARQTFTERKAESQKRYEEKKERNFLTREELLARLQKIIDQKKWQAQGEVSGIERKFENMRPLPATGVEEQDKKFNELKTSFDEKRIEYMVEIRQKEEDNLTGKLITLEKMEEIGSSATETSENWGPLDSEMAQLARQWKKIGRVPKEKENETWDRFRKAQDLFNEKRMKFDISYKKEIDKLIKRRETLISKAESLMNADNLATAARDINRLHADWKKLENVPKELNDQLWERFKAASDKFNEFKSENASLIKDQEQANLEAKESLCEQASALASSENFRDGTQQMDKLFSQWKEIGPVPSKKSGLLWRKFHSAMDEFYKNRRSHFKEARNEQQENLKRKNEIIDRIKELTSTEDLETVVKEVQDLQAKYKEIGFVPIKMKDKVWKTFRDSCDEFFNQLRQRGSRASGSYQSDSGTSDERKITSELFKLRKEADKARDQILKYKDNMTYFKPNKKGLELRSEIQDNIDDAEIKLSKINSRIEELQQELNNL